MFYSAKGTLSIHKYTNPHQKRRSQQIARYRELKDLIVAHGPSDSHPSSKRVVNPSKLSHIKQYHQPHLTRNQSYTKRFTIDADGLVWAKIETNRKTKEVRNPSDVQWPPAVCGRSEKHSIKQYKIRWNYKIFIKKSLFFPTIISKPMLTKSPKHCDNM